MDFERESTRGGRWFRARPIEHVASAAAVVGCVLLLLADGDLHYCAPAAFDETFEVSTTCFAQADARIHVTAPAGASWYQPTVTINSGSLNLSDVSVSAVDCQNDGDPRVPERVTVTVAKLKNQALDGGAGRGPAATDAGRGDLLPWQLVDETRTCVVDWATKLGHDVQCSRTGYPAPEPPCTLRLVRVPK